jgi:diguanylate cyclase (GGDEF)-like protein
LQAQLEGLPSLHAALNWCKNLDAALPLLQSEQPSLIFLYQQCQDDGQALNDLLATNSKLPIISITEQGDDEGVRLALHQGAVDCLNRQELSPQLLDRSIRYALLRSEAEQKLNLLHLHDPLTGIANRQLFRKNLDESIQHAKAKEDRFGLLLINLDGFKKVNETYGHDTGDELVNMTAQRLTHCIRNSDLVARIGADEFTVILDDCRTNEAVEAVAKKIIDVLAAPFTVEDSPFMVSCSIGVAIYPEGGASVDELLLRANMAMTAAKATRGSQFCLYSEEANNEAVNRLHLESDLRRALRRNEFELYYQPRVDLESGDSVGIEALIRWHHPKRGLVSPAEFIPLAEESGLIVPIGYWVLQQACSDMSVLDEQGCKAVDIAVNLSFKQLQDEKFVETASRIIRNSGVDATRLEFELTETAVMSNYQQTLEGMEALSELGITFSLDDFGTGFSSFAHIQRLPISALKVDRSFVSNVNENEDDAVIVQAIINLAHSLRLHVVAEGAETLEQIQFLWQNNCDQVQGYYFSPPVPLADFCRMANQRATAIA